MKGTIAIAACAVVLGACAYPPAGPGDYHAYQVRGEQSVNFGVVESVRDVRLHGPNTGVGAASGSAIGMVAGSNVGGGSGQFVGAVAGTILGGIIGNNVEQSSTERPGVEVTVLLDSGKYLAVVQENTEPFRAGDRVRVLSGRGLTRVTH
jgi:outer membrane lipoprotein SlyB